MHTCEITKKLLVKDGLEVCQWLAMQMGLKETCEGVMNGVALINERLSDDDELLVEPTAKRTQKKRDDRPKQAFRAKLFAPVVHQQLSFTCSCSTCTSVCTSVVISHNS